MTGTLVSWKEPILLPRKVMTSISHPVTREFYEYRRLLLPPPPAERVYLVGSPFINLAVFEPSRARERAR